jgi:hypothetical protein
MEFAYFFLLLWLSPSLASFYAIGPPGAPWTYDWETRIKSYDYQANTEELPPEDSASFENDTVTQSKFVAGSSYFWMSDTSKFKHAV